MGSIDDLATAGASVSPPEIVAYIGVLVWKYPDLLELFGEHLEDNEGEVLAHPFMYEVEKWAEGLLAERRDLLVDLLDELDGALSCGRQNVVDLIGASFVENLPYPGEPNSEIRELLPSGLRALLSHCV